MPTDPDPTAVDPAIDARLHRAARVILARPPTAPADPDRFSSTTLFGQPGLYPQGTAMAPAPTPPGPTSAADDDAWIAAALAALAGTIAAPVAAAFPDATAVRSLRVGVPASPGRVVGPAAEPAPVLATAPAPAASARGATDPARGRVVNVRYRGERPELVAPSLAHDLLWSPATTGHAAEAVLHAVVAMVHLQLIARDPSLARTGTELARRQSSLAITLLCSRAPGSPEISLVAPDGPGTIPGGAPSMSTPDFWSVPFGPVRDEDAPPLLAAVLDALVGPGVPRPHPLRFDEALGGWLSDHLDDRWLPLPDRVRASAALGLLDPAALAAEAGVALDVALAAWSLPASP